MPDAYRYPTSWWAPGEVFSDTVQVDLAGLAPGSYTVTVGLYEPESGMRLPVLLSGEIPAVNDWVVLQELVID